MSDSGMKKAIGIVTAIVVVAVAATAVIVLLNGVSPGDAAGTLRGVGGTAATGNRFDVDQRKSLPLDGVQRIEVEVVSSDVTVTESADGSVSARLHGTVSSNRGIAEPQLVAEDRGSTVSIRVDHRNVNVLMGWYRSDLKLEVAIPKGYRGALFVHGVSADIALPPGQTFTDLEAITVSGDIALGAFTADSFRSSTVSGDLEAPAAKAKSADLGSTSGTIEAGGLTGDLSARTISGDLRLAWTSFSGSIDVTTTSGDVMLGIPAGSGFSLDAGSTSGRITSDHPVTVRGSATGPGRHSLTGDVGSGKGSVRVRTVSGGIRIGM
jgi:DUF4097 and DUF4098 domain-containing protein YvlB